MERITGEIQIKFTDSKTAELFFVSLKPETIENFTDRSNVSIEQREASIYLKIDAKDITAFRASLNSYLIWTRALFSVSSLIDQ